MSFWTRHRQSREDDLDRELRTHLDLETAEQHGDRFAAQRALGNTTSIKENTRDMWGSTSLEQLAQDVRHGLRLLVKTPGLTVVAVLTLALVLLGHKNNILL